MTQNRRELLLSLLSTAACTAAPGAPSTRGGDPVRQPPRYDEPAAPVPEPDAQPDPEPLDMRPPADPLSDAELSEVVSGINDFAVDLHQRATEPGANAVLSPASVALALGMVHAGARGETASEIAAALHQEGEAGRLRRGCSMLLRTWNDDPKEFELSVVDRLFGDRRVPFEKDYLDLTATDFRAPLETMDFVGAAEPSRARINTWVAEQTHDRIRDLLPPGAVTAATKLVLVNAIYLKARWMEAFNEGLSREGDFWARGGKKTAKMMHRTDHLRHATIADAGVSVLELPYENGELAMVLVLPTDRAGLAKIEAKLSGEAVAGWIGRLSHERVALAMPRFRIEMPGPIRLKGVLTSMGIRRVFDYTQADFTAIAPASEQLEISEGYHKAFIEVNEKGTEAAAATAFGMRAGSAPPTTEPIPFVCDHPFAFAIRDTRNGALLFTGRVADPTG